MRAQIYTVARQGNTVFQEFLLRFARDRIFYESRGKVSGVSVRVSVFRFQCSGVIFVPMLRVGIPFRTLRVRRGFRDFHSFVAAVAAMKVFYERARETGERHEKYNYVINVSVYTFMFYLLLRVGLFAVIFE